MLPLLLACAPPAEPQVLLTGWEYEWAELSHRISYLRVGVEPDTSLDLGLVGGDWSTGATYSDTPMYRVRYERLEGRGYDAVLGTASLDVGPDPEGSTTLTLDASTLPEGRTLVAILNGFSLDTGVAQPEGYPDDYNPAYGYASMGFGFSLGEPTRDGDELSVPVNATVRWGPQDREDMNAAIPYAVTAVTVDVAVFALKDEPDVGIVQGSRPYDDTQERPYTDQPPMEMPFEFEGGPREGLVGWRSFDLQLNLEGTDAGQGDYLRAFGAELVPTDAEARVFDGVAVATMSTSSLSEWSDPYAGFQGEVVRLGVPDVIAEHWVVSGSHPTGPATTGPTAP